MTIHNSAIRMFDRLLGYFKISEQRSNLMGLYCHILIFEVAGTLLGVVSFPEPIIIIFMSIELILNAVNINLIGFAAFADFDEPQRALGQVLVIFVITIAAAELALAMAIILRLYRNRSSVNVDEIDLMKW